ncbi:FlgD immunoglobulin-like domain containing protein [Candidatus Eisenbacteria bacterium]|uniref:FlgD immunoglobulin-like domain containing protein n=1 Tax=Eiseniibacteriota bacterium TaxID=2212470 RepID=A0ABV6YJK2_UNCEI
MKIHHVPTILLLITAATAGAAAGTPQGADGDSIDSVESIQIHQIQRPNPVPTTPAWGDTMFFGYFEEFDGEPYAIWGETWTFDHTPDYPLEGWTARDASVPDDSGDLFWRLAPLDDPFVPCWESSGAVINGLQSAWIGACELEAYHLCWVNSDGAGYGNGWFQRFTGPELHYLGWGWLYCHFDYWCNTEQDFDSVRVYVKILGDTPSETMICAFTGEIGNPQYNDFAHHVEDIAPGVFGNEPRTFQLVFEMTSDSGASDEDDWYATQYGAFAFDDLELTGNILEGDQFWNFEGPTGAADWVASTWEPVGTFLSVQHADDLDILTPCPGFMTDNVLTFFDDNSPVFPHPVDQYTMAISPIMDISSIENIDEVGACWDTYASMPLVTCVFYRPSWMYYPQVCESGKSVWSDRIGVGYDQWLYREDPQCFPSTTTIDIGYGADDIPPDADQVRFVYEVHQSCETAGQPPSPYTEQSPFIDNVRTFVTGVDLAADVKPDEHEVPARFALAGISPNPSSGSANVRFGIPSAGQLNVSIIDVSGRLVRKLADEAVQPGETSFTWDGRSDGNRRTPPGVYFVRGCFEGEHTPATTLEGRLVILE